MAEKPILFNAEMVRAILDGRKTQTRRLVKEIPPDEQHFTVEGDVALACDGSGYWYRAEKFCRVQPGDVLWVRETFCGYYLPSVERWPEGHMHYEYRASNPNGNKRPMGPEFDDDWEVQPWRPSIHMPKEAARIFLKVKGVRCERLQSISYQDIVAELGTVTIKNNTFGPDVYIQYPDITLRNGEPFPNLDELSQFCLAETWMDLWDSTIKKDDLSRYGWAANPWVWVIEFERCEKP